MDRYTLIFVADERSPVRRLQIPKVFVKRAVAGLAVLTLLFFAATWDYWRLRADNAELAGLRVEAAEQREQIRNFRATLEQAQAQLDRVQELERKVRIIANLPGAAAVGGGEITEALPPGAHTGEGEEMLPAGVPIEMEPQSAGGQDGLEIPLSSRPPISREEARRLALTSDGARLVHGLGDVASVVEERAASRGDALDELIVQLDDKRVKLASMPSIWPARGWLTSRFGTRISPFTGRAHLHAGIDIAARPGTEIISPARGRVQFVGSKGPLGKAVVVDHGFGVRTFYGHTQEILVKPGQEVDRGQRIALIGNTGRSTGPHLHYTIEVNGKPKDPLDYIFN